ncbi:uncharacterized protein LOC8077934 isoform X2 [Sorghum bicolor]|uniref:uncharacterized protein LOC8077934 isoform X2 n=1 Tax=Sorghum bicolor TaxID=4558 RepID=UPI000B425579|nr:uncharacterized protein LOC8077934 isoform X2 [Sorghum bicolor]|eukprot:XP_021303955.1 uncharacterized protein LOC8077934 isoform X2 [Sorghum bicolor]
MVAAAAALLRRNGGRAPPLPTRKPGRLFRAVAGSSSGADQFLRCSSSSSASQAQRIPTPNVRCHPRQPPAPRVRRPVRGAVLGDGVPEAVPLLLPEVLRDVPVRAGGHLRQQEHLPLLQQLEDQEGRPQVPLVGLLIRGST